jgi:hypothetical protein
MSGTFHELRWMLSQAIARFLDLHQAAFVTLGQGALRVGQVACVFIAIPESGSATAATKANIGPGKRVRDRPPTGGADRKDIP